MSRWDRVLLPTVVLTLAAIATIDLVTPRGVATGALYVIPVLLAAGLADRRGALAVAVIATILNLAGYVVSAPLAPVWLGPVNRTIATIVIWGVAALGWSRATAQRSAQIQRDRWRTTLASIGDAVAVTNGEGRIDYMNAVAEQLSGWPLHDARGRSFDEVLRLANAQTRASVENPIGRVLAEGRTFGLANHTILLRRDGTDVPIDDSAAPIRDSEGTVFGAVIVFRDVTERYRAEARLQEALRESARRAAEAETGRQTLDALMAYIPEGVTIADAPDARVRMVSRHGLRLLQRDGPDLLGPADRHPATWGIFRLDGSQPAGDELPLTRAVAKGEVISNELWTIRRPDGTEVIISCNAGPIVDHGATTGGVIAWRDVTEQQQMQKELRRQAEALRVHDRMKDTFVSMISHELRQPLNAMRAAVQLIRVYATGVERVAKPLDVLERQTQHLTRLVEDLLDASRLREGKFTVTPADTDLSQIVRDSVETLRSTAADRGVRLLFAAPDEPLIVPGDGPRLQQVVSNLVTNAIQHSDSGGVVTLTLAREGAEAALRVRDTGRGIAADLLPHLFDTFVQGEAKPSTGLGLGLSIAKGIVDLHHGTLVARSDGPSRGAEFEVRLPLAVSLSAAAS